MAALFLMGGGGGGLFPGTDESLVTPLGNNNEFLLLNACALLQKCVSMRTITW